MKIGSAWARGKRMMDITNDDVPFSYPYGEKLIIASITHNPKYLEAAQNLQLPRSGAKAFKVSKADLSPRLQKTLEGFTETEKETLCNNTAKSLFILVAPPGNEAGFLSAVIKRVKVIIE